MVWAIEGYELLAEVGQGQTGLVISARDTATGATVAIRYLTQDVYETPGFAIRFRGEVAMLGLVEHPNVANVYELVEENDAVGAVVTELVDGMSLREVLQQSGPLEPHAALYVAQSALQGLGEVHGTGIVHRSVKPENLLLDANGTVKVVDIGLSPPSYNRMPANPIYAAPELWFGEEASPTSDVFAATAVLFECLTGQPPHGAGGYLGRSGETADAAIAAIHPDLAPHEVRVFMAHGLAADPMARLGDARTALEQLNVVAHIALGPNWFETGHGQVQRRLAGLLANRPAPHRLPEPMAYAGHPGNGASPAAFAPAPAGPGFAPAPAGPSFAPAPAGPSFAPSAAEATAAAAAMHQGDDTSALTSTGTRLPFRTPAWDDPEPAQWASPEAPGWDGEPRPREADAPVREREREPEPNGRPKKSGRRGGERPAWEEERRSWLVPEGQSHRAKTNWMSRVLITIGVVAMLLAGGAYALTSAFGPDGSPQAGPSNTQEPSISAGPTVPVPSGNESDTVKPSAPGGLKVTSRSVSGVSLDWTDATDNIEVAGYIIVRDGERVGTTYDPGYTDAGLESETRYQYAVAAFDAAGNVSASTAAVAATTLKEPDVSPPARPTLTRGTLTPTSVALRWTRPTDNVGVARYELFRDGVSVIQNLTGLSFVNSGLRPSTRYEFRLRAFDASNNASPLSAVLAVTTPASPTTPPQPTTPPPTTPAPTITSVTVTATPSACDVAVVITVVASGPMTATLTYSITGVGDGSVSLTFAAGDLSQTRSFTGNGAVDGTASGSAGGQSDNDSWTACVTEPPT
jgi:serine/threonine protein kinase/chitodextrinase